MNAKLKLKPKKDTAPVPVRVTDPDGNYADFESVHEAAKWLGVSSPAVFQAIRLRSRCRGCEVARR